jgi:hypothetical protein
MHANASNNPMIFMAHLVWSMCSLSAGASLVGARMAAMPAMLIKGATSRG